MMFESGVNLDGTQTREGFHAPSCGFESGVNLDGTQTLSPSSSL